MFTRKKLKIQKNEPERITEDRKLIKKREVSMVQKALSEFTLT